MSEFFLLSSSKSPWQPYIFALKNLVNPETLIKFEDTHFTIKFENI